MRCNFRKTTMTILLVLCMAVSMFAVDAFAKDNDSTTTNANSTSKIDTCERKVVEYTAARAKRYIAGDNTYPEVEGYLFAGWYNSEACNDEADAIKDGSPSGEKAYALFLPEHVLSIRAQASATLIDDDVNNDEKGSMRFVTSVDSLLYKTVGFEISYQRTNGSIREVTSESKNVYSKLYVAGTTTEWKKLPSDVFCNLSKYFKICTLKNFSMADYMDTDFQVKPYWVTLSGDKVYGVEATKSFEKGCLREEVWVTSLEGAADAPTRGGYNNPYKTLDYAISHVNNEGTIIVKDILTMKPNSASEAEWTPHGKTVTITGESQSSKIDFTGTRMIRIYDNVTFENITLDLKTTDDQYIFAEGNKLVIKEDVVFSNADAVKNGNAKLSLFGGSRSSDVQSTDVELYAGTYVGIYGGSNNAHNVLNDTKVTVGNKVNANIDATSHNYSHLLLGGGYDGTVYGNTYITVKTGAKFNYIFGGGESKAIIKGSTNVDFSGQSYCVFGGSYGATNSATNGNTHVIMRAGEVYQLFGGSFQQSMTGNTDVRVLGGTVHRRIYGGCYNNCDEWTSVWDSSYHVTGYTSVTIGPDANVNLNKETDKALIAGSRDGNRLSDELGILIFNANTYEKLSTKIGSSYFGIEDSYHYLVKATAGGEVTSVGDMIYIKPDSGKVATVTIGNEVKHYTEGESYYLLPSLTSSTSKETIVVTFGTEKITDFSAYEAKIGSAYYRTLEEAIAVAEKTNVTVEKVSTNRGLATITVLDSENGAITANKKNCIAGEAVTLTVTPDSGYYLRELSVKKDGEPVEVSEAYGFVTEDGAYTVEATFTKNIFTGSKTGHGWDTSKQYMDVLTLNKADTDSCDEHYIYFGDAKSHDDVDFTVNVKASQSIADTTDKGASIQIKYNDVTQNGNVKFVLKPDGDKVVVTVRTIGSTEKNTKNKDIPIYELSTEQVEQYKSAQGIDWRVVRCGTEFIVYVGGERCTLLSNQDCPNLVQNNVIVLEEIGDIKVTNKVTVALVYYGKKNATENVEFKYNFETELNEIQVTTETSEHGSVKADSTFYLKGDTVTLTGTGATGYYCYGYDINGEEEIVGQNKTYSFKATKTNYKLIGLFKKDLFVGYKNNGTCWDTSKQYQDILSINHVCTKTDGSHEMTFGKGNDYQDFDFTINGKEESNETSRSSMVMQVKYNDTRIVKFWLYTNTSGETIITARTINSASGTNTGNADWRVYTLTADEASKYKTEGIDWRVVRQGTTFLMYIDGQRCNLKESGIVANNVIILKEEGEIKADNPVSLVFVYNGIAGQTQAIDFKYNLQTELDEIKVTTEATENGTINTDSTLYLKGDTVKLTATPNDGYFMSDLTVKKSGVEVPVLPELAYTGGTYSFVADGGEYTVEATFAEKVFTDPTSNYTEWNLMKQNQGSVDLTNGRTGIQGTILATAKAGAESQYDTLAFKNKYIDMDLALKIKGEARVGNSGPETMVFFDFGNGKVLRLSVVEWSDGVHLRSESGLISGRLYTFSETQKSKYLSEGVELRIVRKGTQVYISVDGEPCAIGKAAHNNDTRYYDSDKIDLSSSIGDTTQATVSIRRKSYEGTEINMPFTICGEVKDVFGIDWKTDSCWDFSQQYLDIITLKKTCTSNGEHGTYVGDAKSYDDFSFAVKVKETTYGTTTSGASIQVKYNDSKLVKLWMYNNGAEVIITARTVGEDGKNTNNIDWRVYTLTSAEATKYKNEGVEWRVARQGTKFVMYIDGQRCNLKTSSIIKDNMIVFEESGDLKATNKVSLAFVYYHTKDAVFNLNFPYKLYTTVNEDF